MLKLYSAGVVFCCLLGTKGDLRVSLFYTAMLDMAKLHIAQKLNCIKTLTKILYAWKLKNKRNAAYSTKR